jgi:hypothetical protein
MPLIFEMLVPFVTNEDHVPEADAGGTMSPVAAESDRMHRLCRGTGFIAAAEYRKTSFSIEASDKSVTALR